MEALDEINWALLLPFFILQGILLILALIDICRNKQLNGPKWMWILIVLVGNILGSILYFIFGRRQNR
ncbi:PLD nuclease N-terminal domain-containing protein [Cytobacillus gottheilii]|uniref:PLDc_N domain-containing protein n=1 Tax=Cytobacillus gottheilii TaxID=859144 RepID=A0ABX8F6F0_9BACI|nr:PLD nuclease N-terminal domain-containing protein [Cytobacillus gottheilii]QVY60020.1 PLDc_N domain-containing protein [Cytobacillus gottheilii]